MTYTTRREVDPAEWEAACKEHKGLIYRAAKKWNSRFRTVDVEDLAQKGRIAIRESLSKFDPTRGIKFSTFINSPLDWAMSHYATRNATDVRIPYRQQEKLWDAIRDGDDAAAAKLRITFAHLDEPLTEGGETLAGVIGDEHDRFSAMTDNGQNSHDAREFLNQLDDRKRKMFELYFGITGSPMGIMGVAGAFGISRQAVEMQMLYAIRRYRKLRGMASKECYLRPQVNKLPARKLLALRPGERITITRPTPPNHSISAFGRRHGRTFLTL